MSKNKELTQAASDDDAPDLSAPYWADKFAKATVQRGRPKADVTKVSTKIRLTQTSSPRSGRKELAGRAGSATPCARLLDSDPAQPPTGIGR